MPTSEPEGHSGKERLRRQLLPPESAVVHLDSRQEGDGRHDVSRRVRVTGWDRHRVPEEAACVVHEPRRHVSPILTPHVRVFSRSLPLSSVLVINYCNS